MNNKLSLSALGALVIGSMIGSGIFALPQNIADKAGVAASWLAWGITGVGMLALALVFNNLSRVKPELNGGVYAYAKAGFGDYMGFSSAWGYWVSAVVGNASYLILLFSALSYFFPIFGEGNNMASLIGASILLWLVHLLVVQGIKQAAFVNIIVTWAKIVPLVIFVMIGVLFFKLDLFQANYWQGDLGSTFDQAKNMMLVTVWVFIGIEGANLLSGRAENRNDIGKATIMGFLAVLALLIFVNMVSMGLMNRAELAGLKNPSTAYLLEQIIGKWGAILMALGLIISLSGALLAWVLFSAEILFVASSDGTMPKCLRKVNDNQVPVNSLLFSNAVVQIFLIISLISSSSYNAMFYLATSMILVPYFFCAAFGAMVASKQSISCMVFSWVALIYSIWLIYAAGIKYLLLSAILYAFGLILFIIAKREQGKILFDFKELLMALIILVAAFYGIIGLINGTLTI